MLAPLRELRVWRFGLYYVVVFGAYVAFSLWLPSYYRSVYGLSLGRRLAAHGAVHLSRQLAAAARRLAVGSVRRARRSPTRVFIAMLLGVYSAVRRQPGQRASAGPRRSSRCVEVLGIGMGIGKASVYKYIPEYFPQRRRRGRRPGRHAGGARRLPAAAGLRLPRSGFTGRAESCFWVMLGLILTCIVWLHTVVTGMRRRQTRPATELSYPMGEPYQAA